MLVKLAKVRAEWPLTDTCKAGDLGGRVTRALQGQPGDAARPAALTSGGQASDIR